MTEKPAQILGTYHDLKFIRTRGVAQIILEAPLEQARQIVEVLGTPDPAAEPWVAVARLNVAPKRPEQPGEKPLTEGERCKRHFEATVQDERFEAWMRETSAINSRIYDYGDGFRAAMKRFLGIGSANELLTNTEIQGLWNELWAKYQLEGQTK